MNLRQKIGTNPEVVFQEIEGESVLLHLNDARYFGLDDVGTRIWQLIEERGDLEAVFEQMGREYDVESHRLEADLEKLVGELASKGLVVLQSSEPDQ